MVLFRKGVVFADFQTLLLIDMRFSLTMLSGSDLNFF